MIKLPQYQTNATGRVSPLVVSNKIKKTRRGGSPSSLHRIDSNRHNREGFPPSSRRKNS